MRFHVLLWGALVFAAQTNAQDLALKIPPVKTSFEVDGQRVGITAWGTVSSPSAGRFRLALTADLGDLQEKITPLLASQMNRSDRCGERMTVEHASLVPAPPAAVLTVNLHYERWACAKVFGKEAIKRLVGGNGVVEVRLTPSVEADGIAVTAEVRKIEADGSLGELLRSGSLGPAVREKVANSIQSAVRKAMNLESTLPPAIETAVKIESAQFAEGQGRLWISVGGDLHVSTAQFQSLGKQLETQ